MKRNSKSGLFRAPLTAIVNGKLDLKKCTPLTRQEIRELAKPKK